MQDEYVKLEKGTVQVTRTGYGPTPLVLLSGFSTLFPGLEYGALGTELAKKFPVLIPSKFGYGYSDLTDAPRDADAIVEEYRAVLSALKVPTPVVLCAHSMGFLEALYWTQHYPGEVSALVGIDPATPDSYRDFDTEKAAKQITSLSQKPLLRKIAADRYCRQLFRQLEIPPERRSDLHAKALRNFAGPVWAAESEALADNLAAIAAAPLPRSIPTLFFLSNGKGTSMSSALWRQHGLDFLGNMVYGEYILLDLPHNLHQAAPDLIAKKIAAWLRPAAEQE